MITTRKENIFKTAMDFYRTRAGEIERRLYFEIEKKKRKRKKEQGRGYAAKIFKFNTLSSYCSNF